MLKSSANNIPTLERSSDLNNINSTTASTAPTVHSDIGIWTLTHHHHLHHHHHHHHRRGGREEDGSEGDNSSGHHSQHSRSHSQHSHGQDKDKDRESTDESDSRDTDTTSEEDSIELQLEDFKLDDIDLEEYEVIELDIDQLGLGKDDIANALSHEEVLEKLSRSLHDLPLPDDEEDSPSELQGSKTKKKMRRSRLSNVFVGLPRKIRIVRPKG
jgi:uncharacterized sporulation protein YeaH/YhbH (DUF444 family)